MRMKAFMIATCVGAAAFSGLWPAAATSPHFYRDDPIAREPESQDASRATPSEIGDLYEMTYNLLVQPRYQPAGVRAQNLNTIDEVPDSSWFTNRIGTKTLSIEEIVRGPIAGAPPDASRWVIVREKTSGVHPGITAKDAKGETWFLEFDPAYYPEAATAAVVMATKFFSALGYNQVESFITTFEPKRSTFDPKATIRRPNGKRTPFTQDDLDALLEHVARKPDGSYRVVAGRLLPGRVLGNFRYQGTRPDDPNDLVPHEHRRELRALRVFGAWTNLTDLKSRNTLDTLVTQNGRAVVKHWLQDVGSTFGMCNDRYEWDLSWEHFYQGGATAKRAFSFGFALNPWQTVHYVEGPPIGKFEGDRFDPRTWRPQTATTAYMELRDDDAFWAARRVAAFSDEMIRAIIHTGEFTDAAAEKSLGDIMIKRRNKIMKTYLPAVNPITDVRLTPSGELMFRNAAVDADLAVAPKEYVATWQRFDNATGSTSDLGVTRASGTTIPAPADLPSAEGAYVRANIAAIGGPESWKKPAYAYFLRETAGWRLVGFERVPDGSAPGPQQGRRRATNE